MVAARAANHTQGEDVISKAAARKPAAATGAKVAVNPVVVRRGDRAAKIRIESRLGQWIPRVHPA